MTFKILPTAVWGIINYIINRRRAYFINIIKILFIMNKEHIKALLLFAKLTYGTCDINFDDCINCLCAKAKELGMDYKEYLTKVVTQSQLV